MEGASGEAVYETDFYAGSPVLTRNSFGEGTAWYVASRSSREFYHDLKRVAEDAGVEGVQASIPGVEVCERQNREGRFLFFLNHGREDAEVTLEKDGVWVQEGRGYKKGEKVLLKGKDVMVYQVK